jgi:pyruvate/2-oxoglutarate/acetoin dehydrogenase E1 component
MELLAEDERTVFIGQAVEVPGTAMSGTLGSIPMSRRIEFPVAEDCQMGVSIGLALGGLVPVSLFTRWNFLLLAANQLINHLDKLPVYSRYRPKVIIRTGVGSERPMHPGPQHTGNFTKEFEAMCKNVRFVLLDSAEAVVPAYQSALSEPGAFVLVEVSDLHNE